METFNFFLLFFILQQLFLSLFYINILRLIAHFFPYYVPVPINNKQSYTAQPKRLLYPCRATRVLKETWECLGLQGTKVQPVCLACRWERDNLSTIWLHLNHICLIWMFSPLGYQRSQRRQRRSRSSWSSGSFSESQRWQSHKYLILKILHRENVDAGAVINHLQISGPPGPPGPHGPPGPMVSC